MFFFVVKGVYFEKVLKSSDTSLWVRNIQMYLSGIVVTLAGVYLADGAQVIEKGFFFGYTPWVCFVVCESNSTLQTIYTIQMYLFSTTPVFPLNIVAVTCVEVLCVDAVL